MNASRLALLILPPLLAAERSSADPVYFQQAFLKGSNTESLDFFGHAVAISGNLAAVSASREDSVSTGYNAPKDDSQGPTDNGAVYLFTRTGLTWVETGFLKASNAHLPGLNARQFGSSLAISGNTLAVGSRGEESNATGVNGDQTNQMAGSAGAVYVFVFQNGVWTQQAYLKASNTGFNDFFGSSVAISGNVIVVGAPGEDGSSPGVDGEDNNDSPGAGAAYIYERNGTTWTLAAYLKAANTDDEDQFGASVAVSGQTVVVGAGYEDGSTREIDGPFDDDAENAGAVYVFVKNGNNWEQQAYLKPFNVDPGDRFGTSVAIDGDRILAGSPFENGNSIGTNGPDNNDGFFFGAVYEFTRSGTTWSQGDYIKAEHHLTSNVFGHAVALEGNQCVISAKSNSSGATGVNGEQDDFGQFNSGAAYRFVHVNGTWTQSEFLKASNTSLQNEFGESVAISGRDVLVGCPLDDADSQAVNGDDTQNPDNNFNAGSAYLFHLPTPARMSLTAPRSFPATKLRRRSRPRPVVIANVGEEPLTFFSARIAGAARRDFLVQGAGRRVLPGLTRLRARMIFKPRKAGLRRATLIARSNVAVRRSVVSGRGR